MMNIIIEDIKEKHGDCRNEITAQMITGPKRSSIWFCWNGNSCPVPGDVFLCTVLQRAMNSGDKLIINGSVSSRLVKLLPQIQEALLKDDNSLRPVDVVIKTVLDIVPRNKRNEKLIHGSFFNRDIDTLYTLLKRQDTVDNLLVVHGDYFGSYLKKYQYRSHIKYQTSILKKQFFEVATNANSLHKSKNGAVNLDNPLLVAAISLIYSHKFSRLYIPSSNNVEKKWSDRVYGLINAFLEKTGPALVPHGSDVTEDDKINAIAANNLFTEALRICWENPTRSYNCGRCPSCTRKDDPIKTVAKWGFNAAKKRG
jgi:hypothetical protein